MGESLFILGGSSIYTPLLLRAIAHGGAARSLEAITLYGRNWARLAFNVRLGSQLMQEVGAATRIDATTDFAACLDERYGILFNQMRIGGMIARDRDEKAALAVGLPADETLGIVGVSNAIRSIRKLHPYFDTLSNKRSGFLFINFTNPCSIITQWLTEMHGIAVLGICDYPEYFRHCLATLLGVAPSALDMHYFGLNHCAFVHDIHLDGRSVLSEVLAQGSDFSLAASFQAGFPYLFVPGWEYAFEPESVYARQRAEPANRAASLLAIERDFTTLLGTGSDQDSVYSLLAGRNCAWYEMAVAPLLQKCLGTGDQDTVINGDAGDIFGLGRSVSVVETNARVDRHGVRMASLPLAVKRSAQFDLCRLLKRAELSLLDGVLAEDWDAVMAACILNPMIRSVDRARRYFRSLIQDDPDIAAFCSTSCWRPPLSEPNQKK